MSSASRPAAKRFTLDEANRSLPLVRSIVEDLASLATHVVERRQRVAHLVAGRDLDENDPYTGELAQIGNELERDAERLDEYHDELKQLGVILRNAQEGLIDFPAVIDGRTVFLCWKLGEPEVLFWHEIDAGFAGRRPLATSIATGGGPPDRGMIDLAE